MPQFRKRPVVIEAEQFDGRSFPAILPDEFLDGYSFVPGPDDPATPEPHGLRIRTLEGTMLASPGDWIIKGVNGEFYPCKDDIFQKTYEPVEV